MNIQHNIAFVMSYWFPLKKWNIFSESCWWQNRFSQAIWQFNHVSLEQCRLLFYLSKFFFSVLFKTHQVAISKMWRENLMMRNELEAGTVNYLNHCVHCNKCSWWNENLYPVIEKLDFAPSSNLNWNFRICLVWWTMEPVLEGLENRH